MTNKSKLLQRLRNRIRYFNKSFLNRVLGRFTTLSFGPFAMVLHQGRKSGNPYQTPIIVAPMEEGFLIALTYGPKVDWYRNILEAGHCKLRWHRREFEIERIEPVAAAQAGPYLPGFERRMLRLLGVDDFAKMWRAA
jgi:deazaflavin-dependent oxidoreductase (nitroreductase family)